MIDRFSHVVVGAADPRAFLSCVIVSRGNIDQSRARKAFANLRQQPSAIAVGDRRIIQYNHAEVAAEQIRCSRNAGLAIDLPRFSRGGTDEAAQGIVVG